MTMSTAAQQRYSYGEVVADKLNTIWVGTPLNNPRAIDVVMKYFLKEMAKDETIKYTTVVLDNGYTAFQLTMSYGLTYNDISRMTQAQITAYNAVNNTSHVHPKERFN